MRRRFGTPMLFHSEAEWRVVEHDELHRRHPDRFQRLPTRTLLNYRHGHDLMTVVFPDARTQHAAMVDARIAPFLTDSARPAVAQYHIQEIGEL
jgi:hypothetical protein